MGLGGCAAPWDDLAWEEYEWFDPAELPPDEPLLLTPALQSWLEEDPVWLPGEGHRLLLADLDNLRSRPAVWRGRMALVAALARDADHVVISGQEAAVSRAQPFLAEWAGHAEAVAYGADLADLVLLAGAAAVQADRVQVVVVSNDNIFAELADRGPLTVLSPGADALSDRLRERARLVLDLVEIEGSGAPGAPGSTPARPPAPRGRRRSRR